MANDEMVAETGTDLSRTIAARAHEPDATVGEHFKSRNSDFLVVTMPEDLALGHREVEDAAHRSARWAAAIASDALE